jgi:hypothetical protein
VSVPKDNGAVIKDALAEQGFLVKVAKKKNNKPQQPAANP